MVVNACTMFNCQHEWVVLPGALVCHKCTLRRQELALSKVQPAQPQLMFFPTSQYTTERCETHA